jgi:hypothetical protein
MDSGGGHPAASGWRWLMLPLWSIFFLMGLVPDGTFLLLRRWGLVVTQSALVNSWWLLFWGLVGFVTFFAYARCREAGLSEALSRGKAFTVFCYALVGFHPVDWAVLAHLGEIRFLSYKLLILGISGMKVVAWLYLWALVLRYHFFSGAGAFIGLPTLLPSLRGARLERAQEPRED